MIFHRFISAIMKRLIGIESKLISRPINFSLCLQRGGIVIKNHITDEHWIVVNWCRDERMVDLNRAKTKQKTA